MLCCFLSTVIVCVYNSDVANFSQGHKRMQKSGSNHSRTMKVKKVLKVKRCKMSKCPILFYLPSGVGGIASPAFSYLRHWFVLAIACIMWFKSQFAIVFFFMKYQMVQRSLPRGTFAPNFL